VCELLAITPASGEVCLLLLAKAVNISLTVISTRLVARTGARYPPMDFLGPKDKIDFWSPYDGGGGGGGGDDNAIPRDWLNRF